MASIVEEITVKSATLPPDLQHEILDFVDFVIGKRTGAKKYRTPFKSVRGILDRDLSNLDADLIEVRCEMWRAFPRKEPE